MKMSKAKVLKAHLQTKIHYFEYITAILMIIFIFQKKRVILKSIFHNSFRQKFLWQKNPQTTQDQYIMH